MFWDHGTDFLIPLMIKSPISPHHWDHYYSNKDPQKGIFISSVNSGTWCVLSFLYGHGSPSYHDSFLSRE
jgi:hypothetical protein